MPSGNPSSLKEALLATTFFQDPHKEISALLANYSKDPESEAQLKVLLPQIISVFGADKSVKEMIEVLKTHRVLTLQWHSGPMRLFKVLQKVHHVFAEP
ncbi:hypothetical protein LWI29_034470 [Acer saccharum]|uniref:Uncharacterized protein n=1 Tax=Acer saccharum TaxID=4024 RepID=A0AA39RTA5_ACESA|nr:hypothetical protein LWI29_034470 [Acer saccharum]